MAGRRFDVADVVDVLKQWHAGRSDREISGSLGMGRERVAKIRAKAEKAGLARGGPPLTAGEWTDAVRRLYGAGTGGRIGDQERRMALLHEEIVARLKDSTVTTVWRRLCDERGLNAGLSTFRRYVRKYVGMVCEDDVTVRKPLPAAGEIAEVDYGRMALWFDPIAGRPRVVQAFVMVLAFSRRIFVRPVVSCDQAEWVACHREAFEFLRGVPHVVRLDNLKTGVLKADIYDPQLNRTYREFAEHCGFVIDPCRARRPKDKPQVERQMPYVRDSFWSGREWHGVQHMQDEGIRWSQNTADARPHGALEGTVGVVFAEQEAPALLPLPAEPFEMAAWAKATVHPDCHVQNQRRFFSVPWKFIGRVVDVRVGERVVRVYVDGELIKTHTLARGQRRYTDDKDYPPDKVAFLQRTPQWCRREASEIGEAAALLVANLLPERAPLHDLRQAQAIVRLVEKYGKERVNAGCLMALDTDGSLRTVRNILKNDVDRKAIEAAAPATATGAFLHGEQTLLEGVR